MKQNRKFHPFTYKDSNFKICCGDWAVVTGEIMRQRGLLESYIARHPEFKTSLVPLVLLDDAPPLAVQMAEAAVATGVGPLAAVAGGIAQAAALAGIATGERDIVVDNGGDCFMKLDRPLTMGIHAGRNSPFNGLAFRILPEDTPLSICSSSSNMGHSKSFGKCDLATIVSKDATLADAAATLAANLVCAVDDLRPTAEKITKIPGILGVLLVKDDKIALLGSLPEIVENQDPETSLKITRDINSNQP